MVGRRPDGHRNTRRDERRSPGPDSVEARHRCRSDAFAGKLRGGFITQEVYREARTDLETDARDEYALVASDRSLVDEAIELTGRHRLRGYDAIHLACALRLNRALIAHHLPSILLVSADNDLLAAAAAEGLPTDNPNNYP